MNDIEIVKRELKKRSQGDNFFGEVCHIAIGYIDNLENTIKEKQKHLENLQAVNEELEKRIDIMEDGQSGWHFSGTPELPGDALYVYVIVWTGHGHTFPLTYCKRSVRGKYVFRYEWVNGDIYRGGEIKAWKYFPEPPNDSEQEAQRDYEQSVQYAQYCERYEPTYNPEDGSM